MGLTDDDLRSLRGALYIADDERSAEIDAVFEMALAHNAAKKVEPVAWMNRQGFCVSALLKSSGDAEYQEAYSRPLYEAAPPDLAAKLKEARELLERCQEIPVDPKIHSSLAIDIRDFLARTK